MAGLDDNSLREKIKQRIPKPLEFSFSAKAFLAVAFVALILILIVGGSFMAIIPAGHVGVLDRFGVVSDTVLSPGFNFKDPLTGVHEMNTQTQQIEYKEVTGTLTSEGLEIKLDSSVLWHLDPTKAPTIYRTVRGDYIDTKLTPSFMGLLRAEIKKYTAEDIYTNKSTEIQADVEQKLKQELDETGIIIERVWLRGIFLPKELQDAITIKQQKQQQAQQMQFTIQQQEQEAKRLVIEAKGIAEANRIKGESVTPTLVSWEFVQGIKANPNVLYVPIGSGGGNMLFNLPTPNLKS
jgi:regulator of protease activity HflC (stomatin/prohibitin superfamily)